MILKNYVSIKCNIKGVDFSKNITSEFRLVSTAKTSYATIELNDVKEKTFSVGTPVKIELTEKIYPNCTCVKTFDFVVCRDIAKEKGGKYHHVLALREPIFIAEKIFINK